MKILLKNIKYLVTQNKKREILENHDLLINENQIKEIKENVEEKADKIIDCSNKIVLPGLINVHTHLGMGLLRGYSDDKELHDWLNDVVGKELTLTDEEFYEGSLLGCRESLRFGTTTVADMYYPMTPTAKAVIKSGIRAWLFVSYFNAISDSMKIEDVPKMLLPEELSKHKLITQGLAPHSPYGATQELLEYIRDFAKEKDLPKMIHLAETRKEKEDIFAQKGDTPLNYLDKIGFVDENTILVHSVWLTKGELKKIADKNAKIAHCPASNMKLASGGVMPFKEMHELGIKVGLATDSVASNNNLDMFEEMKFMALLHKQHYWDPCAASAQQVLDCATIEGSEVLNASDKIGSLEEGKLADIVIMDVPLHLTPITKERVVSHLVYSANGNDVSHTIVNGELLLEDKEFVK